MQNLQQEFWRLGSWRLITRIKTEAMHFGPECIHGRMIDSIDACIQEFNVTLYDYPCLLFVWLCSVSDVSDGVVE